MSELGFAGSQEAIGLWPRRGGGACHGMNRPTVLSKGARPDGVIRNLARTRLWNIGAPGNSSE